MADLFNDISLASGDPGGAASLRFAAGDPSLFTAEEEVTLGALESSGSAQLVYRTANQTGPLANLRYVLDSATGDFGGSAAAGFTGTITGLRVFDGSVDGGALLYSVSDFALPLSALFDGSLPGGANAVDISLFSAVNVISAEAPLIDTAALLNTRIDGEADVIQGADRDDTAIVAGLSSDFTASGSVESFLLEATGASATFLARFDSIEFIRFDDATLSAEALLGVENRAPEIDNPVADQTATVGVPFSLALPETTFSDPDEDQLTISVPNGPSWLAFDPATGLFSGTPTPTDVGTEAVTVRASDGDLSVDDVFDIVVAAAPVVNNPPTLDNPVADQTATVGVPFNLALPETTFSDLDQDPLTISVPNGPSWLSFDAATGLFSGTPTATDIGTEAVTVRASDGALSIDDMFDITVAAAPVVNNPPQVDAPVADQTATVGVPFNLTLPETTFSDLDDDPLTITVPSGPSWLSFDAATGLFSGTPTATDIGTEAVTVRASDGDLSVDDMFDIVVAAAPVNEFLVTTASDTVDATDGVTSLREAIAAANASSEGAPPVITFDPALAGQRFVLTGGQLEISRAMEIDGTGVQPIISGDALGNDTLSAAGLTNISATLGGGGFDDNNRIFNIVGDVTLRALTLTGGRAPIVSDTIPLPGEDGPITVLSASGGAIAATGNIVIADSLISGNIADTTLGAPTLPSDDSAEGGGATVLGTLLLDNTTVTDNEAVAGTNAIGGGIVIGSTTPNSLPGELTLIGNSQIIGNRLFADFPSGAGVYLSAGTLDIQSGQIINNIAFVRGTFPDFEIFEFEDNVQPIEDEALASSAGETFQGGGGSAINGTTGIDTVEYTLGRDDGVTLAEAGAGVSVALPDDTADTLTGIERVALSDGIWLLGLEEGADTVYRLFVAAFGRTPDEDGLLFWESARQAGMEPEALAESFVASPEFEARFGGPDPADALYVAELYDNVLGRDGDPEGQTFWEDRLAAGDSRAEVLLAFAGSQENRDGTAEDTDLGLWVLA